MSKLYPPDSPSNCWQPVQFKKRLPGCVLTVSASWPGTWSYEVVIFTQIFFSRKEKEEKLFSPEAAMAAAEKIARRERARYKRGEIDQYGALIKKDVTP